MTKILMTTPEHFDVKYAINPHMTDANGMLNKVDRDKACRQWTALKQTFIDLGVVVETVAGHPDLPDMVFSSNHGLPLPPFGDKKFLMGKMASENRAGEILAFANWYEKNGWEIDSVESEGLVANNEVFEGMGDACFRHDTTEVWAGFGPRTSATVWDRLSKRYDLNIQLLELTDSRFYHLDTCFAILDKDTAVYVPGAISWKSEQLVQEKFSRVIRINESDASTRFAGNCWCPDGQHVVVEQGSLQFEADLTEYGFTPVPVDTSEFIKSGGSVYCLKMILEP